MKTFKALGFKNISINGIKVNSQKEFDEVLKNQIKTVVTRIENKQTDSQKLDDIEKLINDGQDTVGLIKLRNILYNMSNMQTSDALRKDTILKCIKEMISEG